MMLLVWPSLMAAPAPEDPLIRIQYDYEVASYCGLISPSVASGFKRQMAAMIQQHNISRETLLKARSKSSVAVYKEWQNRSLGGFKGWCRKEGAASVRRFTTSTE
jgi:hypothetical protein